MNSEDVMNAKMANCPYCNTPVSKKKLMAHVRKRCTKAILSEIPETKIEQKKPENKKKRVLHLKDRLDKIMSDLESQSYTIDNNELANEFKAFYCMYVMTNERNYKTTAKPSYIDGALTNSIKTISGGLPSLGKKR